MDQQQRQHHSGRENVQRNPGTQQPMKQQQRIDTPQRYRSLDGRDQQIAFFISRQARRSGFELLARLGQHRFQLFTSPDLSPEKTERKEPLVNSISDLLFQPTVTLIENRTQINKQLFAPAFEILDEQRLAFDTRHDARREVVGSEPDDSR